MQKTTDDFLAERFSVEVMNEIWDGCIARDREPSEELLDALTVPYGKSRNELRRYCAVRAKATGNEFMKEHLRDTD